MKLFQVNYLENNDDETYLTVGTDDDTSETIEKREYEKRNDWNCLYFLSAREIEEVDGHKIIVEQNMRYPVTHISARGNADCGG